jgi:cytochrome oxidase assembly protein ShyY1
VLVNRGWVPPYWRSQWAERYAALQPSGRVAVAGVMQGSESPSSFVPVNDPAAGDYFWLDVPGIVRSCVCGPCALRAAMRCVPCAVCLRNRSCMHERPRSRH